MFMAYLSKEVAAFQESLKNEKGLVPAIQGYIETHQKDEEIIQVLSECVAYLPIEDLTLQQQQS